jgi:hypothetical protein
MGVMGFMGSQGIMERKETSRRIVGAPSRNCERPNRASSPLYAGRDARRRPLHPCTTGNVRLSLLVMPPLTRADLAELHCIQPIENICSILERGILSNYGAKAVKHASVADPLIQDLREPVWVPGPNGTRRKLHSYANLYVNARNKMLSKLKYKYGDDLGLCVLRVSLDVLDLPGVVVASQNASSDYARFAAAPGGLSNIDKDLVFAPSWKHPNDQIMEWRHGSIINAEVLVPDVVPAEFIEGAYVSCTEARTRLRAELDGTPLTITVNENLFFRA